MGYVEPGELPPEGVGKREDRKRLDELLGSERASKSVEDVSRNGFNAEQREIFEDLILGVQHKQVKRRISTLR